MPSQRHLPEQGRDPAQPPDPLSVGTRKPLAPKCQIVVICCTKKQNKKKGCYLSQQQDRHPLHPGDTRTRANIKIHIIQDRRGRALSPPPPPSGKQPPFTPASLGTLRVPATPEWEGGVQAGGQKPCGYLLRVAWTPPTQPTELRAPKGVKTEPWNCCRPAVSLTQLRPSLWISCQKAT